jgi:hypothetical protein
MKKRFVIAVPALALSLGLGPLETIGRHVEELTQSRPKGYEGPARTIDVQSELVIRGSTASYGPKGH